MIPRLVAICAESHHAAQQGTGISSDFAGTEEASQFLKKNFISRMKSLQQKYSRLRIIARAFCVASTAQNSRLSGRSLVRCHGESKCKDAPLFQARATRFD